MNMIKTITLTVLLTITSVVFAQFTTCDGTANGSSVSAYAGWLTTTPYTRMDQAASDVVGAGMGSTCVQICLDSPIPKCGGSNDYLIIGDNVDGRAYAVWDDATPVGTCAYIFTEDGEAIIQTIDACAGDFSFSWTTVDNTDPYTNPCDNSTVTGDGSNNDCVNSTPVCSSGTFGGLTNGFGIPELYSGNNGCLEGMENNSAWYSFEAATSGTITIEANPSKGNDDYDFAIWDNWDCPPSGAPIRCSWYLGKGGTGLLTGETDTSEDETGGGGTNGYVQELNVVAGEQYMLLVDGYATATDPNFDLIIGGTATLNCGILSVDYLDIAAKKVGSHVNVVWATGKEENNREFIVERSIDGKEFRKVGSVISQGNGNEMRQYSYSDYTASGNPIYYRIKQVDHDGSYTYSKVVELEQSELDKQYNLTYAQGQMNFSYFNEFAQDYNVTIFGANGQVVFSEGHNVGRGMVNENFDLSGINRGMYFVRVKVNGQVYNEKIIIN